MIEVKKKCRHRGPVELPVSTKSHPVYPNGNSIVVLILLLLITLVPSTPVAGQEYFSTLEKKLDGLNDHERLPLLLRLSNAYIVNDPEKCIRFGEEALSLAQRLGNRREEGEALYYTACGYRQLAKFERALDYLTRAQPILNQLHAPKLQAAGYAIAGLCHWSRNRNHKALELLKKALDIRLKIGNKTMIAHTYNSIGLSHWSAAEYSEALDALREALKLRKETGDQKMTADSLNHIAAVYFDIGLYQKAMEIHLEALDIREKIGDDIGMATSFNNIGMIYREQGDHKKSLEVIQKALDLTKNVKRNFELGNTLSNLASTYIAMKDYEKAIPHLDRSIQSSETFGDNAGKADALRLKGKALLALKRFEPALNFFQEAMTLVQKTNESQLEADIRMDLAGVFLEQGRLEQAVEQIDEGFRLAKKIGALPQQRNAYFAYYNYYRKKTDYKNALQYYISYSELKESIFSTSIRRIIEGLKIRYEAEKVKEKNRLLEKDNRLQILELERRRFLFYLLVAVFVLAIGMGVFFIKRYVHLLFFWKRHKYVWKYRLKDKIGSGGMSVVYRADNAMGKQGEVALKVLRDEHFEDKESRVRFQREAEISYRLTHPNIVRIFETGIHSNVPFIAMELLKGVTLEERLKSGPLPVGDGIGIACQVADAIDFVHRDEILHRDLKPGNIMLLPSTGSYKVKLMDFGLAKTNFHKSLTTVGTVMGTISYMAPELFGGVRATTASDIYSMGIVFYEMFTGQNPFNAENPTEIMNRIRTEVPPPPGELEPSIPDAVNRCIVQMLQKDEALRPSAWAVKDIFLTACGDGFVPILKNEPHQRQEGSR